MKKMNKRKLIVFADYGLDDAAATATLFRHIKRFSHIDLVPIGGNVPADVSYENCLTLLSYYPSFHRKVTVVDTRAIPQPSEYLASIHGKDGMGDLFTRQNGRLRFRTVDFAAWMETVDGTEQVLSLGPMTLVRPLLEKHASYEPVIMGGCVHTPPNFRGYEFNQCLDTAAFAYCTKRKHAAVTLDTCRVDKLDMRRVEITGDDIHAQILRADQALSISRGEEGCYVWDDVTACYLLFPERFVLHAEQDRDGNTIYNAVYVSDKLYFEADSRAKCLRSR